MTVVVKGPVWAGKGDVAEAWERARLAADQPRFAEHPGHVAQAVAARPGQRLDTILVDGDGGGAGPAVLPVVDGRGLERWRVRLPGTTLTVVTWHLSRATIPTETALGARERATAARAVEALLAARRDTDVVDFPQVREGSTLAEVLTSLPAARSRRWRIRQGHPEVRLQIRLGDDYDAYLASRFSGRRRRKMRWEERTLLDGGRRSITAVTRPEEVEGFLDAAAEVWAGSWHGARAAPIEPRSRLADELAWSAARGELLGHLVREGARPIAFSWGRLADATYAVEKMAFATDRRELGPGAVLFAHAVAEAHRRGARLVDLGYGDYPYKREWANAEVATRSVRLVRLGLRPLAATVPPAAYARVRALVVAGITRAGLREQVRRRASRVLGR